MKLNPTIIYLAIIAFLLCSSTYFLEKYNKSKKEVAEKENILSSKEIQFKNVLNQNASQVEVWMLKYSELEKAHSKEKSLRSDYENRLSEAYESIELYKRKNKDLEYYISSNFKASDTIYQQMPADCYLRPIRTKHIDIDFIYSDTMVGTAYSYRTSISQLITLYPKRKENGSKHWPNWGFIWGWDNVSIMTVEDKNAAIRNQMVIQFKK